MPMAGAYPELSGKPERSIGALSRTKGEGLSGESILGFALVPFANLGGTANISPHTRGGVYFFTTHMQLRCIFYQPNIIMVYY